MSIADLQRSNIEVYMPNQEIYRSQPKMRLSQAEKLVLASQTKAKSKQDITPKNQPTGREDYIQKDRTLFEPKYKNRSFKNTIDEVESQRKNQDKLDEKVVKDRFYRSVVSLPDPRF